MDRQEHWEGVHRTKGQDEVSWYEAEPTTSLALVDACGLEPGDGILDVGAGASRFVDRLLERGHTGLAVLDVSAHALRLTRERLGPRAAEVSWFEEDVTRFAAPRQWRLWHDRAVFHFLTRSDDREAYRSVLAGAVAPEGHVIIATFASDGPLRCSGLDVVRYSAETLAAELGGAFFLEEHRRVLHTTPGGARQPFLYARFRKRG